MVLRFFFEQAVSDRFMRMTKSDVRLFFDAFYEENPEARKVWDSWKKTHDIPENSYLVDPAKVEQNTYATHGESQLSLNCLKTFKTQRQLQAELVRRSGGIRCFARSQGVENNMEPDADIIARVRAGELPVLTSETIPQVTERLKEISARFAAAMLSPYVGPCRFSGVHCQNPEQESW